MANKNTNPGIGKAAVPTGINNAQPAYSPKTSPTDTPKALRHPKIKPSANCTTPRPNFPFSGCGP